MFVFDACITALLAWFGRKYLPDYPYNTKWLSNKVIYLDVTVNRSGRGSANRYYEFNSGKLFFFRIYKKERDIALRRMGEDTESKLHDSGLLVVPGSTPSSSGPGRRSTVSTFRQLLRNKYLYLFVFAWSSVHLSIGAAHVLGIMAKKLGYDAVTANLLTTVSHKIFYIFNMIKERPRNKKEKKKTHLYY